MTSTVPNTTARPTGSKTTERTKVTESKGSVPAKPAPSTTTRSGLLTGRTSTRVPSTVETKPITRAPVGVAIAVEMGHPVEKSVTTTDRYRGWGSPVVTPVSRPELRHGCSDVRGDHHLICAVLDGLLMWWGRRRVTAVPYPYTSSSRVISRAGVSSASSFSCPSTCSFMSLARPYIT